MREMSVSEDIASEPYAARGDDASGISCSVQENIKRNFVLQQLVAVQIFDGDGFPRYPSRPK